MKFLINHNEAVVVHGVVGMVWGVVGSLRCLWIFKRRPVLGAVLLGCLCIPVLGYKSFD